MLPGPAGLSDAQRHRVHELSEQIGLGLHETEIDEFVGSLVGGVVSDATAGVVPPTVPAGDSDLVLAGLTASEQRLFEL